MYKQRLSNTIRGPSPCKDCTERFLACSDRCPKDERGEYGHKAWTDEIKRVKQARKDYIKLCNVRKKRFNGGYYGEE